MWSTAKQLPNIKLNTPHAHRWAWPAEARSACTHRGWHAKLVTRGHSAAVAAKGAPLRGRSLGAQPIATSVKEPAIRLGSAFFG
eukprot:CAMPEP_0198495232 /NCGR_PEP_ID=MMETSP1462-20131121/5084_1 /TAXON_ID=1333877 /ORGANISM="Brandtodinium nutriculum, Strain RCC3387" /LENGTH=83 /DNA_ID=CAMNT_0044224005 /DNA_START=223 /DNA_END=471 /DNA_ORIENTATION=+